MIIGEIRRYLRDNNSIRVSRSIKDTAYHAMQVKERLMSKEQREPTVSEIAKHFHVSSSYLSSLFSKYMKVGIKQYLQYKKISGAKTMLAGGASVTEVCFDCGFNSCSHFISVFKEATGMTPNKYRSLNSSQGEI